MPKEQPDLLISPQEIRSLRKSFILTQKEFAKILGISSDAVAKWEIGYCRPQLKMARKLLKLKRKFEKNKQNFREMINKLV